MKPEPEAAAETSLISEKKKKKTLPTFRGTEGEQEAADTPMSPQIHSHTRIYKYGNEYEYTHTLIHLIPAHLIIKRFWSHLIISIRLCHIPQLIKYCIMTF